MKVTNHNEIFDTIGKSISKAYQDADARYREQEHQKRLQEIFNQACSDYFTVTGITAVTIRKNSQLNLLPPGSPMQLMRNNGVKVMKNGIPVFCLVATCAEICVPYTSAAWSKSFQAELDKVCYSNCWPRLRLLGTKMLLGGHLGLVLTWGCW